MGKEVPERFLVRVGLALRRERILFILFAIPYLLAVIRRLIYVGRNSPLTNYGITEWLVDFSAGFVRRGLPGTLIRFVYDGFGVPPSLVAIMASLLLLLCFSIYLWRRSKGVLPRWALLTTPLLGFPIYVDWVLMKKDILILLIFALCVRLAMGLPRRPVLAIGFSILLSIGILSHELIIFFGLPSLCLMLFFSVRENPGSSAQADARASSLPRVRPGLLLSCLMLPLGSAMAVLLRSGTIQQGKQISQAWRNTIPFTGKYLPPEGPSGAISYIGQPTSVFIKENMGFLSFDVLGAPSWIYAVLMSIAGVLLLACVLGTRDKQRAWFFVVVASFQFICMGPIFYMAMDVGRWVSICLLSAMIVTVESNSELRSSVLCRVRFPHWLEHVVVPAWVAPLGLAFWGMPIIFYKIGQIFSSSPLGGGLQAYHYLRLAGMPAPRDLLSGLGL